MSPPTDRDDGDDGPVVSCDLQGGTLSIYEDRVVIDRSPNSMFEDKTIGLAEVQGVEYSEGFTTGHIQIRQDGPDLDEPGLISHPVDENTLYFPRTKRPCAGEARDAILERTPRSEG
jgi:hypothetical protein